jgi:hypothetical protein
MQDLALDYAAKVDLFVLNNNATNAKGLLQQTGVTALTYTSGTPTTKLLYGQIAAGNRVRAGLRGTCRPTRSSCTRAGGLRSSPRRLVRSPDHVPDHCRGSAQPGTVTAATPRRDRSATSPAWTSSRTRRSRRTSGAGTNQDVVIVMRAADAILWEGSLKSEAFRETKADQLSACCCVSTTTRRSPRTGTRAPSPSSAAPA